MHVGVAATVGNPLWRHSLLRLSRQPFQLLWPKGAHAHASPPLPSATRKCNFQKFCAATAESRLWETRNMAHENLLQFFSQPNFLFYGFSIFYFLFFFWKTHSLDKRVKYFLFFLRALFGECIAKHIHVVASLSSPPRFPQVSRSSFFAAQKLLVVVNVFELVHSVFRQQTDSDSHLHSHSHSHSHRVCIGACDICVFRPIAI